MSDEIEKAGDDDQDCSGASSGADDGHERNVEDKLADSLERIAGKLQDWSHYLFGFLR